MGIIAGGRKPRQVEDQYLVAAKFGAIRLLRGVNITQPGDVSRLQKNSRKVMAYCKKRKSDTLPTAIKKSAS